MASRGRFSLSDDDYQTAGTRSGFEAQVSLQAYSLPKPDLREEEQFRLKMCVIAAVCFLLNLIVTIAIATYVMWPRPPGDRPETGFIQCKKSTSSAALDGGAGRPSLMSSSVKDRAETEVECSYMTYSTVRASVLSVCDPNSDDQLLMNLKAEFCSESKPLVGDPQSRLTDWDVSLNRSNVVQDKGQFTVRYSGIYVVYSNLAFLCNDPKRPKTLETSYWQEVWVNGALWFRDARQITPYNITRTPALCYRSFLHGLLQLKANDSFRVQAGPLALLHCDREMSYMGLYRA